LEQNYTDRVIHDVGLVITVGDVLKVGEGAVFPSDGGVHYKVVFQIVVFRPFPGELLVGVVKNMDE
jgi:DNA-directed RNA polymerase III subunit RPC8